VSTGNGEALDSPDPHSIPLDGEIWIQAQLRLVLQFQARYGLPLECHPSDPIHSLDLRRVLGGRVGRAADKAMLMLTSGDEFRDCFLDYVSELDHLGTGWRRRLAFNLAIDSFGERIHRDLLALCTADLPGNDAGSRPPAA